MIITIKVSSKNFLRTIQYKLKILVLCGYKDFFINIELEGHIEVNSSVF
jgi:hypothetical protein